MQVKNRVEVISKKQRDVQKPQVGDKIVKFEKATRHGSYEMGRH